MKSTPLISILSLIGFFAGLTGAAADHHNETRTAILAMAEKWEKASKARDLDALMALYDDEAQILIPGLGVSSKERLREFKKNEFAEADGLTEDIEVLDVIGQGNLATEVGKWNVRAKDSQKSVDAGTYMALWQKKEGEWGIIREIWNTTSQDGAKPEDPIEQLTEDYLKALSSGDPELLQTVLADEFKLINPSGDMVEKADLIERAKSGNWVPNNGRIASKEVALVGGVALVTGVWLGESDRKYRFSMSYVKQDGTWRILSDHYSEME